jgi:hypothetical protein
MMGTEYGRGPLSPIDCSEQFKSLCGAIHDLAQGHGAANRQVRAEASSEFAAVSWTGDKAYKLARAYRRDIAAAEKKAAKPVSEPDARASRYRKPRTPPASSKPVNALSQNEISLIQKACEARYRHVRAHAYAHELYIFYKQSELAPQTLRELAPGLLTNLAAIPLHHFYIVSREQPAVDAAEAVQFTPWSLEPVSFRTHEALLAALKARMFPEPPPPPRKRRRRWPIIVFIAASLMVNLSLAGAAWHWRDAIAAWLGAEPAPAPLSSVSEEPRLAALEAGLESVSADVSALTARYQRLEADLAELAARGASAAQLTQAADALVRLSPDAGASPRSGGLDLPPCLPVREQNGRRIPAYLLVAVIGEAGITAVPRTPHPGEPDLTPYLDQLPYLGRSVDAQAFRAGSRALFDQSEADQCRHYVLLSAAAEGPAREYAALRQAVEENFYVYRLPR